MLLAPAQTTATGVCASSSRSALTSKLWSAPRCTPPMPPVAKTRMPASAQAARVAATVVPPLAPRPEDGAEALARALAGDNGPARAVAFAAEAGQFQQAGFPAVICGPGSIDQAHQPDEFIEASQIPLCEAFMRRLMKRLSA